MLDHSSQVQRHKLKDRKDDLYETPACAVDALLKVEPIPQVVWECACGPGSIVSVLRATGRTVYATDLVSYGCPDSSSGRDFLMERAAPPGIGAIVTNPPFKLGGEFIAHALELGIHKVITLHRLAFLESDRRSNILDNGLLARVYVFRKRLPMMHRHGWTGKQANSGMAFAWFVWDVGHSGPTELHRISWEDRECGLRSALRR